MDISTCLLNTQSPDTNLRRQAEEQLNNALNTQMGPFMLELTRALASEGFAVLGRQAAGLYLKNVLDAKDHALQQQKINAWSNVDTSVREQIKASALLILQSPESIARHTGAQVVAKLGVIELPRKEWTDLLPTLLKNVTGGSEGAQHASLETLGYICDGLGECDELDQEDTNAILTTIVDGIRAERPDAIRLAAVTALRHSLGFVGDNFSRESERNHIMQVVCTATQSTDIRVRVMAFECIATIPGLYYEYLGPFMSTLYDLTMKAVTGDAPEVGLQSLEFWSSICDEEADMLDDFYAQRSSGVECKFYIKSVVQQLIPLLTECLKQQEEDQEDGTWNMAMAGATCLCLVAQAVRDDCVDLAMAFIKVNIVSTDWRLKEASIMAFGCILEGPSTLRLNPIIHSALPLLMECMNDANMLVRDTTAWAIGRICDYHASCITQEMIPPLMQLLATGLSQEPRVAHNIAFAIHNLVKAFDNPAEDGYAKPLSPYFSVLFDKLLETTTRSDCLESNLRGSAYEAISMLIQVGDSEVTSHILSRLPHILDQFETTFTTTNGSNGAVHDPEDKAGLQALICGTLLVTIQRLDEDIVPFADRIMQDLLRVFSEQNATADEEAFMAVGALATCMNHNFLRYMEHFAPVLLKGLQNHEEFMVCSVATGVIGDLCRALESQMQPFCDTIVQSLLESLSNDALNRNVKPPLISSFGDLALAIEVDFVRYLEPVMAVLASASLACRAVDIEDEELVEYMNSLRESILDAYTGIVQGMSTPGANSQQFHTMITPYLQGMGEFLHVLAQDEPSRAECPNVTASMVGLIGDLSANLGKIMLPLVNQDFVSRLVAECMSAPNENHQKIGKWAHGVIAELLRA